MKKVAAAGNARQKLLQGAANRTELVVHRGTQTIHYGNDRQRDTSRDQTVFDRGGAGLIGPEYRNHALQDSPPVLFQGALVGPNIRKPTDYNLRSR